ncbi:MAG: type I restriction enzyme HsdR N-terminal domain-containing protein [Bacteroidia bacterium]
MQLNLPQYKPQIHQSEGKHFIKCLVRKKWLVLTPEEWVRQHFLNYLFEKKNISKNRTAVEYGLSYNGLKKRIDILCFDKNGNPELMVECKAPQIELNQKVISQIATYNSKFMVKTLAISNGINHYWFNLKSSIYTLIQ